MMAIRLRLAGTWAVWVLLLCAAGPAMGLDVAVPFVQADFMWAQALTLEPPANQDHGPQYRWAIT